MTDRLRFNLHLPGLLKVLAEHLYTSKRVGIRELVQNAHDSCIRRKIEGNDPNYHASIRVSFDKDARLISISDNGNGLTREEIANYLATIGRGYTRELREQLAFSSPEEAAQLIGQFGLGFLSAFLIANEVRVVTRSVLGGPSLLWFSTGDEHYDLSETQREEFGTTVTLKVKPAAAFLLDETKLREAIRQFADFLPVPITLGDERKPVNYMHPPWERPDPATAIREWIERVFHMQPLAIIPLEETRVSLGHDSITVPLSGFLFVPPGSVASIREFGDLHVYIRRMFICERERDLLPSWARFVRGVVESPLLQPTASRESLHQDENFDLVRKAIEMQLGRGLQQIAREEPSVWRMIVRGHSDVIVGWAVTDPTFFERVEDIVAFRTSRGQMTLPEYLEKSDGKIYFVAREMGSLQEQILAESRDVPAIDASWFAVTPFLEKYAQRHPNIELVRLDGAAQQLLKPIKEEPFARLLKFFRERDIRVQVALFKPNQVPALILYPEGADTAKEAETSLQRGDLPSALAGLVQHYIERKFGDREQLEGTLWLNAANPLIQRLADSSKELLEGILPVLHQMARLFAGRMLNATDATEAFGDITSSLEGLVQQ
jgi:molecular chaperone HtpG